MSFSIADDVAERAAENEASIARTTTSMCAEHAPATNPEEFEPRACRERSAQRMTTAWCLTCDNQVDEAPLQS